MKRRSKKDWRVVYHICDNCGQDDTVGVDWKTHRTLPNNKYYCENCFNDVKTGAKTVSCKDYVMANCPMSVYGVGAYEPYFEEVADSSTLYKQCGICLWNYIKKCDKNICKFTAW